MKILLAIWIFELLGRLHPMLVHFPIGLLIGAFLLEIWGKFRRVDHYSQGVNAFIHLGTVSAILAAIMGWLLLYHEEYSGTWVDNHRIMGIVTVVLSILTSVSVIRPQKLPSWAPFSMLLGTIVSVTIAGHLGASLTHGQNYLTEVIPAYQESAPDIDQDYTAQLATYRGYANADSFPSVKLDQLNLEVRAIFAHNCYQCHSVEKRKGDLALDHKEGVMAGGEHGPVVLPGDASNSEIIRRLMLPREHDEAMPPKGKSLQSDEIELINLWINQGAHWADSGLSIFREAELALEAPSLPSISPEITHPVDRIIHAYFEERDIKWPDPVDDRIFIRRAYLDILGLIPSPEEIDAFTADFSPDKRERLVDHLLEDQHNYAQHWITFWNDLLRNDYTGTGYITGGRKQITDWLYHALLKNKPYNQMIADLVNPSEGSEGFIQGIKWRGAVNSSQTTEMQAAQNVSQSLLGLNLKCASCHNSFVNNLTLDQAYGFANVFSDTTLEIFRCDKPTNRMARTSFLYPQLGKLEGEDVASRLKQLEILMTTPENGRVYRTIVNRYWDLLLGRGIVMPVDEMDQEPWSQDLLDWLAADLIENRYDLKHLLKTILTSKAYQLPSVNYETVDEVLTSDYVFQGPVPRRITAEQFADALSQIIAPVYHSVAYDPTDNSIDAQWIWHREREVGRDILPKPGKRFFRYAFTLDKQLSILSAELLLSVDHRFSLYLNEKKIGEGVDWRKIYRRDVKNLLMMEQNIIALEGENEGSVPNPAGMLLSLKIVYEDSTVQWVSSGADWMCTDHEPEEAWITDAFDDQDWESVKNYGSFGKSHWGKLIGFVHGGENTQNHFARASLVALDPFQTALGRPTRENVTTQRNDEATLLQALELTNGAFFHEILQEGATEWLYRYEDDPRQLIHQLYLHFLAREPSEKESNTLMKILGEEPERDDVEDVLWTMVLLPEFQLIY